MLPKHLQNQSRYNDVIYLIFFILLVTCSFSVFADTTTTPPPAQTTSLSVGSVNAETMLINISQQLPNLMRMVTAIAYVMGMWLIIHGVIMLKHMGESRTMMSREHSLTGPLAYIVVGSMLLYLPSTVQLGLSTFWTDPNPYGYVAQSDQWGEFFNVCFTVVQFIGVIAVIRGLLVLSHMGGQGHQGGIKTGITHIIGGIFCINIYQFVQVILNTLGIQT